MQLSACNLNVYRVNVNPVVCTNHKKSQSTASGAGTPGISNFKAFSWTAGKEIVNLELIFFDLENP